MPDSIQQVANKLHLSDADYDVWGPDRAKISRASLQALEKAPPKGKLVLVSALTPTPAGEGKTTTSIGLAQGLAVTGRNAVVALREPSLGPVFGAKGGGAGGGKSTLHPSDDIDLHFTGDLHAVTSANNLLAAMIDNHLHFDLEPRLHPNRVLWRRVLDVNDRALRHVVTGVAPKNGLLREGHFDITAASEVMAALCLAETEDDLRARLSRMIIGFRRDGQPMTAGELGAAGSMLALLKDAMRPNLAQTMEGVPALIHGGPFANIAHGCSSVLATRFGLSRADYVVTEAGFAFDLGGEKFFDIKCRSAGLSPDAVVLVATVRALRHHGGGTPTDPNASAVEAGLDNLQKHIENVRTFGREPIVAINRFPTDTNAELDAIAQRCERVGARCVQANPFGGGGPGCTELADAVAGMCDTPSAPHTPLYELDQPFAEKISAIATKMYGATAAHLSADAQRDLALVRKLGLEDLPICVAKTQNSLSDDPKKRGRPVDFSIQVQRIRINAGSGFLVAMLGEISRMPGLSRQPAALGIDLTDGEITGRV